MTAEPGLTAADFKAFADARQAAIDEAHAARPKPIRVAQERDS
ncbi:MAG: hypothetical protein ACREQL_02795 [Candidatus Binatia bacterium]